jgi:signal transduction histidine kinase
VAHPERVEVRLDYQRDAVTLVVADFAAPDDAPPGGTLDASGGGYGLTGMRERAELLGGTLTAGSTGHGFRVDLRIPV